MHRSLGARFTPRRYHAAVGIADVAQAFSHRSSSMALLGSGERLPLGACRVLRTNRVRPRFRRCFFPPTDIATRNLQAAFFGGEHRKPRPAGTSPQVHDVPAMQKKEARPGTFRDPAGLWIEKKAATYSPTVRSTIGAAGLNCSVRDGKRWDPRAMAASMTDKPRQRQNNKKGKRQRGVPTKKGDQGRFGRLVMLGCDVATYAPASYRRHRL